MKKKYLKIAALAIALGLIGFIGYFANGLLGNPASKMMAKRTADLYLEKQYPDTDYYIEELNYNFKDGCYNVRICSKSSEDAAFTCYIDMLGTLKYDSYESDVKNRFNTARRIELEYRNLTDRVFESPSFPYESHIAFGTLEFAMGESIDENHPYEIAPYSLKQEELELDKIYDVRELGKEAGHLILYLEDPQVTIERAAEQMIEIKALFDAAKIPFRAMDFSLSTPRDAEGVEEKNISVSQFPYEEIYEEGMAERVKKAAQELNAYYEENKRAKL